VAKKARKRKNDRKRIFNSKRYQIMMWCATLAIVVCSTATFAWYGSNERVADSAPAEVMKPYYLTLRNPSDTATLELAVGNLFPGDVKRVVFCVSNKNNEKDGLDMGVTSFEYSIELIHTENLALEYKIYELIKLEGEQEGDIVVLDVVEEDGVPKEYTSYFDLTPPGTPLSGTDVSEMRHRQAGLTDAQGNPINATVLPINAGKYTSYTKSIVTDLNGNPMNLRLDANVVDGKPTFDSQYFMIEIDWEEGAAANFEKYEKETDMIYLLVEALQPKPEKDTTQ